MSDPQQNPPGARSLLLRALLAEAAGHSAGCVGLPMPVCPGLRALAQDVGDAEPNASPLEGNPRLQPPPQHPDRVSALSGGGLLSAPRAGVVPLSTDSLNSQEPERG